MNAPRRNVAEMLSASEQAFIHAPLGEPVSDRNGVTSEVPKPVSQPVVRSTSPPRPVPRRLREASRAAVPSHRPEPLRSVTLRLRMSVADALRRASIQRSLDYTEPYSQQAIVEEALRDWLANAGYALTE